MPGIKSHYFTVLSGVLLAVLLCASEGFSGPLPEENTSAVQNTASTAPAIQRAELVDEKGNKFVVTRLDDGDIAVSVNDGALVWGIKGVNLLSAHDIVMSTDDNGAISLRLNNVTNEHHVPAATEDDAESNSAVSQSADRPNLPANVTLGSGAQMFMQPSQTRIFNNIDHNFNEQNPLGENSISK